MTLTAAHRRIEEQEVRHTARKRTVSDVSEDTARNLFLVYGKNAIEIAELRCRELEAWRQARVSRLETSLEHVREQAGANPDERRLPRKDRFQEEHPSR